MMTEHWSIRTRIVVAFSVLMAVIIVISGLSYYQTTKATIKREIGGRLIAVGWAASLSVPVEVVIHFTPGDETARLYDIARAKLLEIARVGKVDRIFLTDEFRNFLVDTRQDIVIGAPSYELYPYDLEITKVLKGEMADTPVFRDTQGRYYKRAIVPLFYRDEVQGLVVVESGTDPYESVSRLGARILITILIGVVTTVVVGFILALRITAPLAKLTEAARMIGAGNLEVELQPSRLKEVKQLAVAFEEMRTGIRSRDLNLKALLAEIAHEIRNALGGIELFAGTLKEDLTHDDNAQFSLDRILREVKTINQNITDYLLYARPQRLELKAVAMRAIIKEAQELVEARAAAKQIKIAVEFERSAPETWILDPQQVRQVLVNLITNAVDACQIGGRILIKLLVTEDGLNLLVGDTGCGIPEARRADLFDPFATGKPHGWGLGLSVVKKVVEAHGGAIDIIDYPGYTTCFRVLIPERKPEET